MAGTEMILTLDISKLDLIVITHCDLNDDLSEFSKAEFLRFLVILKHISERVIINI